MERVGSSQFPGPQEIVEFHAKLDAAPEKERRTLIGVMLYHLISKYRPELAPKITGMLLQMEISELLPLLESEVELKAKVNEAVQILIKGTQDSSQVYSHLTASMKNQIVGSYLKELDPDQWRKVLEEAIQKAPSSIVVRQMSGNALEFPLISTEFATHGDALLTVHDVNRAVHAQLRPETGTELTFTASKGQGFEVLTADVVTVTLPKEINLIVEARGSQFPGPKEIAEFHAKLDAAPEREHKNMIGVMLYHLISKYHPPLAPKITGMLLQMEISEVLPLLESEVELKAKVNEAIVLLMRERSS